MSNPSKIGERFLSGNCSAREAKQLLAALKEDPDYLRDFAVQLEVHGGLLEINSGDPDMRDCIVAVERARGQIPDLEERVLVELAKVRRPKTHWRRVLVYSAPLWVVALVMLAFAIQLAPHNGRPLARLEATQKVELLRGSTRVEISPETIARSGDRLLVPTGEEAKLTMADGTTIAVAGDSAMALAAYDDGELLYLHKGRLTARVSSREATNPLIIDAIYARARVLGTELMLENRDSRTELAVTSGLVALSGAGDETIDVAAGQRGVVWRGRPPSRVDPLAARLVAVRPRSSQIPAARAQAAVIRFGKIGDLSEPSEFNPVAFDADEIVRACREAGLDTVVVAAKAEDGFCLWPTAHSKWSVAASPWLRGQGDVVAALRRACAANNLRFGVLYCPSNRRESTPRTQPEYQELVTAQLEELLTSYGTVDELWLAPSERGELVKLDWPQIYARCRELQTGMAIGGLGPDFEWADAADDLRPSALFGSKRSHERVQWWQQPSTVAIDHAPYLVWRPQTAVYDTNRHGIEAETLERAATSAVSRGQRFAAMLSLSDSGAIDLDGLREFGKRRRIQRGRDQTSDARLLASDVRQPSAEYSAAGINDEDPSTWWTTADWMPVPSIEIRLPESRLVNCLHVASPASAGESLQGIKLEYLEDDEWRLLGSAQATGLVAHLQFAPVRGARFRLQFHSSRVAPTVDELRLRLLPPPEPTMKRSRDGILTITNAGADQGMIRYTLDGTVPTLASPVYGAPIRLPHGGRVAASAWYEDIAGATVRKHFAICKHLWKVVSVSSAEPPYPATLAIDEDPATTWISRWKPAPEPPPHELVVDMGEVLSVRGWTYQTRDDSLRGVVLGYRFYLSLDGQSWGEPVSVGDFDYRGRNPHVAIQTQLLELARSARYFKFVATSEINGREWGSAAELGIIAR